MCISCVCVFTSIFQKLHAHSLLNFLDMLIMAEARSSGGVAMRYLRPVLWMMQYLQIMMKKRRRVKSAYSDSTLGSTDLTQRDAYST